ncbi:MAG: RIO1 family regulatory kinase/ATPase, partial [Planctomycetaceae bacterium]
MARKLPYTIRHRRKTYTVRQVHVVNDDKYLLLKKLSRYERWLALPAQRSEFESLVVVHLMPPGSLTTERMRILRRTSTNSPFTPSILRCDLRKFPVAIVTDWVRGQTLRKYVDRTSMTDRPISPYESVRLYKGLVQTLCHFYRATGLVHGDLSPENLVLRAQSGGLSLIDFGSALRMNQ